MHPDHLFIVIAQRDEELRREADAARLRRALARQAGRRSRRRVLGRFHLGAPTPLVDQA